MLRQENILEFAIKVENICTVVLLNLVAIVSLIKVLNIRLALLQVHLLQTVLTSVLLFFSQTSFCKQPGF